MKTVVLGPAPEALRQLIEERRRLGLDDHDEVWGGELHMAPAPSGRHATVESRLVRFLGPFCDERGLTLSGGFNLGEPTDYRVPDLGVHRVEPTEVWIGSAAVVAEIRSPDDETFNKLAFYFDRGVEEVLVADLDHRSVTWFVRDAGSFAPAVRSAVLGIEAQQVAAALGWPS